MRYSIMMAALCALLACVLPAFAEGVDAQQVPGPWENKRVTLPGRGDDGQPLQMHYLEAGAPDRPVVVLLHGFPDSCYGWRYVIPALSADHRVLAPDLRGYAGTDKPEAGYSLDTLAKDVVAFIDEVVGKDAVVDLIAHDWGASIAWTAAAWHSSRLHSVTVLNIPHPRAFQKMWDKSAEQRKYGKFVRQVLNPLAPWVLGRLKKEKRGDVFYREELQHDEVLRPEDLDYYHAIFNGTAQMRPPIRYYREQFGDRKKARAAIDAFPPVKVPMLILWGETDHYMLAPMAAMSCQEVEARCVYAVQPGVGHYLHWEAPTFVVDQWRAFQGGAGAAR